ncbi:PREDICTED: uncharacterized protein LOC105955330 [Erythranthe guttata]|nr:PREDICTED: uncharacterized protein LOC105955330 [Erythranthe guttata]|eukprot:XP_012834500.1 PREDICTED: uncharacterized protein LOC105955330 [Erythranthe guttata]
MWSTTTACFITTKFHVHMVNKLKSPQLRLHCASKDDDLGYHNMNENEDFTWHFCDSFVSNTLFYCTVQWKNKRASFDAFRSKKSDECADATCYYEIWEDGIYFAGGNNQRIMQKKYDWNN